jgi:hypothetical protein
MTGCIVVVTFALIATPDDALAQADPQLALWSAIKRQLTAEDGEEYFKSYVKNSAIPPLRGTLVSALINEGVSKLILAMDSITPEVTLILHNGDVKVKSKPKAGTLIEFKGVAIDFTKDPFMLTFDVSIDGIKGLALQTEPDSKKIPPKK